MAVDENLNVRYQDVQDSGDVSTINLFRPPLIWDGGGTDNDWTTPENWSTDAVPLATDSVRFDGTTNKLCRVDTTVSVDNFIIAGDYGGTVNGSFARIHVFGDLQLAGGTITNGPDFHLYGDFIRSGGVATIDEINLYKAGVPLSSFGGAGLFVDDLIIWDNTELALRWFSTDRFFE